MLISGHRVGRSDLLNVQEYILKCDADFRQRLYLVADKVAEAFLHKKGIGIVSLAGPTCSGKTTAAAMLAERLERDGREVHIISIDDFYYDRDHLHALSAAKGTDKIDYDSEETIDLGALEAFVNEALSGELAHCPVFDFKTGGRAGYRTVHSGEGDVFIFEGIQAIYPKVTALLAPFGAVSVYIAPLSAITYGEQTFLPDEIRLMRRIVRDANFRAASADFTMMLWDGVRENEELNIFPNALKCTYRIDSTHNYELGVLRPYLEKLLRTVPKQSAHYGDAMKILERISDVAPIDSELIQDDSLYKEFV